MDETFSFTDSSSLPRIQRSAFLDFARLGPKALAFGIGAVQRIDILVVFKKGIPSQCTVRFAILHREEAIVKREKVQEAMERNRAFLTAQSAS